MRAWLPLQASCTPQTSPRCSSKPRAPAKSAGTWAWEVRPVRFSITVAASNGVRLGWNSRHHRPVKVMRSSACAGRGIVGASWRSPYGVTPPLSSRTLTVNTSSTVTVITSVSSATSSSSRKTADAASGRAMSRSANLGAHPDPSGRAPRRPGRPAYPVEVSATIPIGVGVSITACANGRAASSGTNPSRAGPIDKNSGMPPSRPTTTHRASDRSSTTSISISPCRRPASDRR